jgi:GntR family transcriptional repressor for pyruvate dehydrogenase complex
MLGGSVREMNQTEGGERWQGEGGLSRRVSRGSVTRQVVDALYEALRSGQYRPGDRLPSEPQLAATLGVGRSAVREAIRELLTLGVVEVRHGKGTFVQEIRPDLRLRLDDFHEALQRKVALDLLEVRLIVEPEAAALAALRASPHDLERLRRDVERLRIALKLRQRPPEDLGFHLDLVRATHNAALLRVSTAIIAFYEHDQAIPTERDYREHGLVLQAVEARNPQAARGAMRAHLEVEVEMRAGRAELSDASGAGP